MTCSRIKLADGTLVTICQRGKRGKKCRVCHIRFATLLCDYELTGAKAGKTCDRELCEGCAVKAGDINVHHCPAHAKRLAQGSLPGLG